MGDMKIKLGDEALKPSPPPAAISRRRPWLIAGGLGLLLGVLIGGLCIALPISLRNKQQQNAVGLSSGESGVKQLKGITRSYYLAADSIDWDYAPSGKDLCHNSEFTGTAELYTLQGIGTKYKKAVYRQYNDSSFKVRGGLGHEQVDQCSKRLPVISKSPCMGRCMSHVDHYTVSDNQACAVADVCCVMHVVLLAGFEATRSCRGAHGPAG
jgi:hypothetical protein